MFYIWSISIIIIMTSHYSIRATRFLGKNSITVLATLLLISYGKLLRNITDVFLYAHITGSDGTIITVWYLDANVHYGTTTDHLLLLVAALFFLVLFLVPYPLLLLLVPFLRTKSQHKYLHCVNKLKPLFDAYYGPFKDKKWHHMWTGILLITHVVILIVFASSSTSNPNANILLMTIISLLLVLYSAMVGLLYKKWFISLFENVYILNLAILGGTVLYYQTFPQDES